MGVHSFSPLYKKTFCVEVHSFSLLYKGGGRCVSHNPGTVFSLNNKGKISDWGTQFFPLI